MKISIILAHPNYIKKDSFNHAICNTVVKILHEKKHEIFFHDLYEEKFDPIITYDEIPKEGKVSVKLLKYCEEIADSDGIIVIHPNWWGQPPAILKGWIDRVFRPGLAYEFLEGDSGEGIPKGLLKAETAVVFNTANTSESRENNIFGDPLQNIWHKCIFELCGVKKTVRKMFRIIVTSTNEERKKWLDEVESIIDNNF